MSKNTVVLLWNVRFYLKFAVLCCLLASVPVSAQDDFDTLNVDGIIHSEEAVCKISDNGKLEYKFESKAEIKHKDADYYAVVVLTEDPFRKIKKFRGVAKDAQGNKIRELKRKDGYKVCGFSSFALYDDNCQYYYDLSYSDYPYTIEYSYTIEFESPFYWPSWNPQMNIPVVHSKYTLIVPEDFGYSIKSVGEMPQPIFEHDGDKIKAVYELKDVSPIEMEPYIYEPGNIYGKVLFAPHECNFGKYKFSGGTWSEFGKGLYNMMKGCFTVNEKQKSLLSELSTESSNPIDICNRLHDSLNQNTRYVAIEVGVGSWQPTPSSETFERGYGDCKDLATLYSTMLNDAGIDTRMVLINAKPAGPTDPDFPSLRFNHAIFFAIINDDTVWTDATCSYCDVGDLPWQDENVYVLTIDSTGGDIIKTSRSQAKDNCFLRKANVSLFGARVADVEYNLSATGNAEHLLQSFLHYSDYDEAESFIHESEFSVGKKTRLIDIAIQDGPDPALTLIGKVKSAVQSVNDKKYVSLDYFSPLRDCEKVDLDDRKYPLDFHSPVSFIDSIFIKIPDSWEVSDLPDSVYYRDSIGSISVTYGLNQGIVSITITRTNDRYFIPIDEMGALREYVRKVREIYPTHFAFIAR